jgi:hypothetical protein
VLACGAAYAAVEKSTPNGDPLSSWDGVGWALTTVTTVGYGDSCPTTTAGRRIAGAVMFVGIGFVAIRTAAAADRFMRAQRRDQSELASVERELREVADRVSALERRLCLTRPREGHALSCLRERLNCHGRQLIANAAQVILFRLQREHRGVRRLYVMHVCPVGARRSPDR